MWIKNVGRVVIEGRERADRGDHDGHRMRVAPKALEEPRHLLMHHSMMRYAIIEILLLRRARQLAIQQQIADLEIIRMFGELIDRVAAMQQHAGVAVDIGDLSFAAGCRYEGRIEAQQPRLRLQRPHIDDVAAERRFLDRKLDRLAVNFYTARRLLLHLAASRRFGDYVIQHTKQYLRHYGRPDLIRAMRRSLLGHFVAFVSGMERPSSAGAGV